MLTLKMKNNINAIIQAMHQAAKQTNQKIASEVAESAKANAPVDSGALRDSIVATENSVEVGADYALFVEIGTEHQAAQPFLSPAVQDHAGDYAAALKGLL